MAEPTEAADPTEPTASAAVLKVLCNALILVRN